MAEETENSSIATAPGAKAVVGKPVTMSDLVDITPEADGRLLCPPHVDIKLVAGKSVKVPKALAGGVKQKSPAKSS